MTGPSSAAQRGEAVRIFLAFAFAYFFATLLRGVTATLAPVFSTELGLHAADLGLLAGAYFLGFASLQLPLGSALDRFGPKRVLLSLLVLAAGGCAAFASAGSLTGLVFARVLIGMGVAACLMAPLTCYRMRFGFATQLRTNSWMLMTGSLGMVASTLPVQWLLPLWGWRGLFWCVAAGVVLAMLLVQLAVPADAVRSGGAMTNKAGDTGPASAPAPDGGYRSIMGQPVFVRSAPLAFFTYGGLIAVQSLWAGPWLTRVAGWSPAEAAGGLFTINLCMLLAFMTWGALLPRLAARGFEAHQLMAWGLPLSLGLLGFILLRPEPAGAALWALWCVACTFVSLSQPAVAQAFAPQQAGRALSAFNLVIFSGVFCIQWGLGLAIDGFRAAGLAEAPAFRAALAVFGLCCAASYLWFLRPPAPWRGRA